MAPTWAVPGLFLSAKTSHTDRPPISEIPNTPRSQTLSVSVHTPLFHLPNPDTVARLVNYRQPTAVKTSRIQPQLDLALIPDTEYPTLPSLHLPSELESSTNSKIYHPLKTFLKQSTSLSNLLVTTSFHYIISQASHSSILVSDPRYNSRPLHVDSVLIHQL